MLLETFLNSFSGNLERLFFQIWASKTTFKFLIAFKLRQHFKQKILKFFYATDHGYMIKFHACVALMARTLYWNSDMAQLNRTLKIPNPDMVC